MGVIARAIHKNTRAQVPVERVINSIGFAPNSSSLASHSRRPKGIKEIKNRTLLMI
jgi:hypothetical protein